MKKTLSLIALLIVGVACSQKNKTEVDNPSDASPLMEEGNYTTENNLGEIAITSVTASSFTFSLTVVTENANCIGDLESTATYNADKNQWIYEDAELGCTLLFEPASETITITETGTCDHGAACSFGGVYSKSKSPTATAVANEATPTLNSILEYYHALPNEYFTCEIERQYSKEQREAAIQYKNVTNGYMRATFDELDNIQLALFKNKEAGNFYLAFVYECGAGCMCVKRHFLEFKNNQWHDRFDDMLPDLSALEENDTSIALQLPEKGTTITVINFETNAPLADLVWKGNLFELVRK
jgi:hypothetical protein